MRVMQVCVLCLFTVVGMYGQRGGSRGGGHFGGSRGGGFSGGSRGGSFMGGFRGGYGGSHFVGGHASIRPYRGFGYGGRYNYFGRGFRSYYYPYSFGFGLGYGLGYGYAGYPYLFDSYYSYPYSYSYPYAYAPGYAYDYAQSAPPVVVQQSFGSTSQPRSEYVYDPYQTPGNKETIYLIAYKDHVIRAAIAYWVEGDTLHYVDREHQQHSDPLDAIDRAFSEQLNRDRRVDFRLPR